MRLDLRSVAGEAAFADPAMVGDFAAELPEMLEGPQLPLRGSCARLDGSLVSTTR